jgi:ATP-dependent Clp protease adapter protein ClpS
VKWIGAGAKTTIKAKTKQETKPKKEYKILIFTFFYMARDIQTWREFVQTRNWNLS